MSVWTLMCIIVLQKRQSNFDLICCNPKHKKISRIGFTLQCGYVQFYHEHELYVTPALQDVSDIMNYIF